MDSDRYKELQGTVIEKFETGEVIGLLYKITGRMDNLPDKDVGKPFFTRTWKREEFPLDFNKLEDQVFDNDLMRTCAEEDSLILFYTKGEAIGWAIDNCMGTLKRRKNVA